MAMQMGGDDPAWWQFLWQGIVAVIAGISAAFWRTAGVISRIDVLETRAEATKAAITRLEDAHAALADAHRVAWEKSQRQFWEMRAELAGLQTAPQAQRDKDEILTAIREKRRPHE